MKGNIFASTAVLAALIGLARIANAECGSHIFTPLDKLPPEVRQEISARLDELLKNIDVDWDHIVVGINDKGQITFRTKSEANANTTSTYSCYGAKSECEDK